MRQVLVSVCSVYSGVCTAVCLPVAPPPTRGINAETRVGGAWTFLQVPHAPLIIKRWCSILPGQRREPGSGICALMGVTLKSETPRSLKSEKAEAAPHLHVPRPDGDVEAEILRSPACPGPGRRFPAEEKLTCLSGVMWAPVPASVCICEVGIH